MLVFEIISYYWNHIPSGVNCQLSHDSKMAQKTIPPPLTAQDRSSFAYKTIKDRLPVIVVKTIDFFHRQRKELHKFGGTIESPTESQVTEIERDAKDIISELSKLRKDLETNKPALLLECLDLEADFQFFNDDIEIWNRALQENKLVDGSLPRWFDSPWLLMECYLYRKIKEATLRTRHLKTFDPFVEQKQSACKSSISQMIVVSTYLREVEKVIDEDSNHSHPSERSVFGLFISLALWANKSDLSISGMNTEKIQSLNLAENLRDTLDSLQENILCDNTSELWFKASSIKNRARDLSKSQETIFIDLVADNSGYELFVDLCLIHFLSLMFCHPLESGSVRFRIHLKRMPWFVSDALRQDVDWLVDYLTSLELDVSLQALGKKWRSFLDSGFWQIQEHNFWTSPYDYSQMKSVAGDLYSNLSKSSLIIFKGDLNYRKLTGDRKWHILTPFRAALRDFSPSPLVTLRTAKADVVVGIEDISLFARINNNELPRDWMISGDYGLIQFVDFS